MPPFIHLLIDFEWLGAARMLRNDNLGTALVERCDNRVAVERLVPNQRAKTDPLNERLDANSVSMVSINPSGSHHHPARDARALA